MSLKVRLLAITSLWLLLVLLIFNTIAYYVFIHSVEKNEVLHLIRRANLVLKNPDIHNPQLWSSPTLLTEYFISEDIIRIIDLEKSVKAQSGTDTRLIDIPAHFTTEQNTTLFRSQGIAMAFVQMPIYSLDPKTSNLQIASLEIGRNLTSYTDSQKALLTILLWTSFGILIVSVVGGSFFYSTSLFKPLHQLAIAMQGVQKDGDFRRLPQAGDPKNNELIQLVFIFNEMIARLEAHSLRQNQFVLDASHELRTPLTIIESYSDLLRRWGGDDPKLREEAIDTIHSEAIRLKGMTAALLDLVVRTPTDEKLDWIDFNLTKLIDSVAQSLQVAFSREIEVLYPQVLAPLDIYLTGSPEKIRQLFIILIDNAIKYSDIGIQIKLQDEPLAVSVSIVDCGVGIPEDELEAIFERFYRVDKARNRKTGGVGLGLPIAQNIVRLHGGTIVIHSTLGEGTIVTVQLYKNGY
ncbi:sensor histidine kinase [Paenibacillus psychroresistens]|uniref:histidine kinase n=1 Tax=Paenibacillus psychroresistens TaxID=1778678 RepID=A0A6B8RPL7_9BACL|nr:HAMP domain-containing sensor histidine kinase [Paenibacillus psychroresistens]QGQ97959.1 sensor histidine kinase [Paenibacillus psychroresistens]